VSDPEVENRVMAIVDHHVPRPRRIMRHLGVIVLVSLVIWLAFFWVAPITLVVPPEATSELSAAERERVRLFFGLVAGLPTVILGVLVYCLWLLRQGRKARRQALSSSCSDDA